MSDKRSESQWPDSNNHDMPEGVDWSWTAESQQEQADHEMEKRRHSTIKKGFRNMTREEEDVENSKRSRGER